MHVVNVRSSPLPTEPSFHPKKEKKKKQSLNPQFFFWIETAPN